MTNQQLKSALQRELKAQGFKHKVIRVFESITTTDAGKTKIQLDRKFTNELLEWLNTRFENGIKGHEYFVFSVNTPNEKPEGPQPPPPITFKPLSEVKAGDPVFMVNTDFNGCHDAVEGAAVREVLSYGADGFQIVTRDHVFTIARDQENHSHHVHDETLTICTTNEQAHQILDKAGWEWDLKKAKPEQPIQQDKANNVTPTLSANQRAITVQLAIIFAGSQMMRFVGSIPGQYQFQNLQSDECFDVQSFTEIPANRQVREIILSEVIDRVISQHAVFSYQQGKANGGVESCIV